MSPNQSVRGKKQNDVQLHKRNDTHVHTRSPCQCQKRSIYINILNIFIYLFNILFMILLEKVLVGVCSGALHNIHGPAFCSNLHNKQPGEFESTKWYALSADTWIPRRTRFPNRGNIAPTTGIPNSFLKGN